MNKEIQQQFNEWVNKKYPKVTATSDRHNTIAPEAGAKMAELLAQPQQAITPENISSRERLRLLTKRMAENGDGSLLTIPYVEAIIKMMDEHAAAIQHSQSKITPEQVQELAEKISNARSTNGTSLFTNDEVKTIRAALQPATHIHGNVEIPPLTDEQIDYLNTEHTTWPKNASNKTIGYCMDNFCEGVRQGYQQAIDNIVEPAQGNKELKDLKYITDEDAIEVVKIAGLDVLTDPQDSPVEAVVERGEFDYVHVYYWEKVSTEYDEYDVRCYTITPDGHFFEAMGTTQNPIKIAKYLEKQGYKLPE